MNSLNMHIVWKLYIIKSDTWFVHKIGKLNASTRMKYPSSENCHLSLLNSLNSLFLRSENKNNSNFSLAISTCTDKRMYMHIHQVNHICKHTIQKLFYTFHVLICVMWTEIFVKLHQKKMLWWSKCMVCWRACAMKSTWYMSVAMF